MSDINFKPPCDPGEYYKVVEGMKSHIGLPSGQRPDNWLPETYALNLTSYDLGWLIAMLYDTKEGSVGEVCEPGPDGEVVPTTFRERFRRKLQALIDPLYEGEEDGNDSGRAGDSSEKMP